MKKIKIFSTIMITLVTVLAVSCDSGSSYSPEKNLDGSWTFTFSGASGTLTGETDTTTLTYWIHASGSINDVDFVSEIYRGTQVSLDATYDVSATETMGQGVTISLTDPANDSNFIDLDGTWTTSYTQIDGTYTGWGGYSGITGGSFSAVKLE